MWLQAGSGPCPLERALGSFGPLPPPGSFAQPCTGLNIWGRFCRPCGTLVGGNHEPSHKSRARVAGYFQMSRRDMGTERWPMIVKQSCEDFSRGEEKSLVRHYPY